MLRHNISKNHIEGASTEELRYLFYLSRNNAWVSMGDELVKLNILELIESTSHTEGNTTYFGEKRHPLNAHDNNEFKYLFSRMLNRVGILGCGTSKGEIIASEHPVLPPLELNHLTKTFTKLLIYKDVNDQRFRNLQMPIAVCAKLENYDALFIKDFNEMNLDEKMVAIEQFDSKKQAMFDEAFKNAVWLAATSGDNQQLALLLDERQDFDIQALYNGKNIVQAMFSAEKEYRRPYLNKNPDYEATLQLLLDKGFDFRTPISSNDARTTIDVCISYKKAQSSSWFFESKNPHYLMLIDIIEKSLSKSIGFDTANDSDSYCNII